MNHYMISHHKNDYYLAQEMTGGTHNKDNTTRHLCTFAIWAWIPLFFKAVTAFCATVGDSKSTNPYPVWIKWITGYSTIANYYHFLLLINVAIKHKMMELVKLMVDHFLCYYYVKLCCLVCFLHQLFQMHRL